MHMSNEPIVFIVDDDEAVRESLYATIHAMSLHTKCFDSAEAFLDAVDPTQPGCLLLDVRMPGMTGIKLQEQLVATKIDLPVIIITGHADIPMAVQSMQQGAVDFLEKPYRSSQLRESVREALRVDAQRRQEREEQKGVEQKLARLTESENDVVERIVSGRTNKQIASELDISLRTVQFRRSSIMKKLDVDSRAALIELVLFKQGW